ncbi:DUF2575 domain-containing protein, partial [Salmonella enterica]|nr:DUF2575 domain-containing protein [Salmonella enterica]MDJ5517183.1 DUF2575 domain-containing protein [Salmonella enterica]MDJ8471584.1 DUF2575 domain-containing protein [Salmonella enterica]
LSMRKIALSGGFWGGVCRMAMKSIFFMFHQGNRRLTLTAVQGILLRFSLF